MAPYSVWVGGISALELRNAVTPVGSLLVEGAGALAFAVAAAAGLRLAGHTHRAKSSLRSSAPPCWPCSPATRRPSLMPPLPVGGCRKQEALERLTVIAGAATTAAPSDPYRR